MVSMTTTTTHDSGAQCHVERSETSQRETPYPLDSDEMLPFGQHDNAQQRVTMRSANVLVMLNGVKHLIELRCIPLHSDEILPCGEHDTDVYRTS